MPVLPTSSAVPRRAPSVGGLALALLAASGSAACGPAERAELAVVLQGIDLDPATVPGELRLRIVDQEDGAIRGEGTTTGGALEDVPALFRASDLEPGRRVRVLVDGAIGEPCTARGRAVGRSRPFLFRGDDQTVVVPFACAEQFVRPPEPPAAGRIGHALVPMPGHGALLVGGAGRFDLGAMAPDSQVDELVPLVERYAPDDGVFAPVGELIAPRTVPGVVALLDDAQAGGGDGSASVDPAVAIVGGTVEVAPGCLDDVERFTPATGQSRAGTPLPFARCAPTAGLLPATGEVLVAGGRRVPADPAFLLLPPDLSGEPRIPVGAAGVARRSPRVVTLADGASALVLGGVSPTEARPSPPVAERVRVSGCPDGSEPCADVVAFDGGPSRGLVEMEATWVPCLDPGARGGAVYVSGGRTGPANAPRTLDQVWCARDDPDAGDASMRFRPAGRLDRPRTGHTVAYLPEPVPRLLVVGGASRAQPAAVLAVDGCTCAPATPLDADPPIVLPWAGDPTGARSATLEDGTVLVVGGVRRPTGDVVFEGTGEAALWFPDFPPVDGR